MVLSDYSSSESVSGIVSALDDFIIVLELEDALHWTEDLLLCNGVLILDIREDSGLDIPSLGSPSLATHLKLCTLSFSLLNIG